MSLVRLTIRNAGRAPVRGGLTVVAVAVTLVAFLLLRTLSTGWKNRVEETPDDRLVIRHELGWGSPLPVHYADEVRTMPDVKRVSNGRFVRFTLPGKEGVFFRSLAVDARDFVEMHTELSAPAEQKEAFINDRRGAVVSFELAKEQGWKLGDTLRFEGPEFPGKWELTVSAIVESTRAGFGERAVWIHYDYYNDSLLPEQRDQLNMIAVQIADPKAGGRLAQSIDIHFDARSAHTLTQDDKALNAAIVGRFGAILATMNVVSLLVLGVLVLILGNTVAMSTRERTREFGTLRAIGFSPAHLAAFVLGEAATLGLAGGVVGLAIAYPILEGPLSRYLEEEMRITPLKVAFGDALIAVALGAALGLVAAGLPALRAARLEVTRSLSQVA